MLPLLHAMLITGLGVIPAPTPTSEHTRESHEDTDGEVSATTLEDWIQPKVRLQAWHVTGTDEAVPIELPRVRFGLKGSPRGWVNYKLQLALEDDFEVKDARRSRSRSVAASSRPTASSSHHPGSSHW